MNFRDGVIFVSIGHVHWIHSVCVHKWTKNFTTYITYYYKILIQFFLNFYVEIKPHKCLFMKKEERILVFLQQMFQYSFSHEQMQYTAKYHYVPLLPNLWKIGTQINKWFSLPSWYRSCFRIILVVCSLQLLHITFLWVCRTVQLYMEKLPLLQQPCCINLVNICKMSQSFKYTILNANCIDPFGKTVEWSKIRQFGKIILQVKFCH